jgi:hypothetical protein
MALAVGVAVGVSARSIVPGASLTSGRVSCAGEVAPDVLVEVSPGVVGISPDVVAVSPDVVAVSPDVVAVSPAPAVGPTIGVCTTAIISGVSVRSLYTFGRPKVRHNHRRIGAFLTGLDERWTGSPGKVDNSVQH